MPTPSCVFCCKLQKSSGRAFVHASEEDRIEAVCYRAHFGASRKQIARFRCDRHSVTSITAARWRNTLLPFVEKNFSAALESLELVEQRAEVEKYYFAHRVTHADMLASEVALDLATEQANAALPEASTAAARDAYELANDDICYFCKAGGDLICCERCPRSYHELCLSRHWAGAAKLLHALKDDDDLACHHLLLLCTSNREPVSSVPAAAVRTEKPAVARRSFCATRSLALSSIEHSKATAHDSTSRSSASSQQNEASVSPPAKKPRLALPASSVRCRPTMTQKTPTLEPVKLRSWVSGQSFSVRVDRGSVQFVVKYFYTSRDRDTEFAVLQQLAAQFAPASLQLYVRSQVEMTPYPRDEMNIRATLEMRIGRVAIAMGIGEEDCRRRASALLRKRLCFHHYSFTLADSIADSTWRVVLLNAYRSSPNFIRRSDAETADLLIGLLVHCFTGMLLQHNAGVLLGDCKPGNMFVPSDAVLKPVFADHGYARAFVVGAELCIELQPREGLGTRGYRAPEAEPSDALHYYTASSDAFSLASSLVDVLCGSVLETTERRRRHCDYYMRHCKWPYQPDALNCGAIPHGLLDVLLRLLATDPLQRITLTQAIAACNVLQQQDVR